MSDDKILTDKQIDSFWEDCPAYLLNQWSEFKNSHEALRAERDQYKVVVEQIEAEISDHLNGGSSIKELLNNLINITDDNPKGDTNE